MVENRVAVRSGVRKGLAQLLQDPIGGGISGHIEVENPATAMLDHEGAIQKSERNGRHREKVQCDDRLTVILQESEPAPAGVAAPVEPAEITSHSSFRNVEAELPQFAVDSGSAPPGIVRGQLPNQFSYLGGDPGSPAAPVGLPTPLPPESRPVPGDHRIGLNHNQHVLPA